LKFIKLSEQLNKTFKEIPTIDTFFKNSLTACKKLTRSKMNRYSEELFMKDMKRTESMIIT